MSRNLAVAYEPVSAFVARTGVPRSTFYKYLAIGHFRAKKLGKRTLVDVPHGLAFLASLPECKAAA